MVGRDALFWIGYNEDLVGSLGLLVIPGKLGHCAKEAISTLGRRNLGKFLGDFAIESKLLELGEAQMANAIVPLHELDLIVDRSKLDVFSFLEWR